MERKALGRGLGALIPINRGDRFGETNDVLLSEIVPNRFQPREQFDETALDELVASIRRKGVLQPLVVRRVADGYELIAGERRFRAAQRAGLQRVPVFVRDADDDELLELALIENLQREDLNPLEEARAYRRLIGEFALTQEQVSEKVGKDRSTVANTLRLLQLSNAVQELIASGKLAAGHARALVNVRSETEQLRIAREIVSRRLSVRDTEHLVRAQRRPATDPDHRAIEEHLARSLGTKVKIHLRRGGRGKIEVQFFSLAELNGLVERLTDSVRAATNF
ncbi:MAG: ParB/RepB/Spo0J family partition protein [Deltaproteobacteria bacterium]|nr:ParB/RepB/Spo0J family partition protein [Deltaproteobacteria bacterium]MBI3390669.1 ParB/RepB/Spo0J family partition protein [Deltaproteobacteria bacterium]